MNHPSTHDIYHYLKVDEQLITAGQPTATQLEAAAAEGLTTVINLAIHEPGNSLEDEARLVRSLGMAYHHIPVVWEDPQVSDFAAFEALMNGLPTGKTLLHCAANYRATAFYSLYALRNLGWTEEQAEAFRAQIWTGSDYPVWEAFIARIKAQSSR